VQASTLAAEVPEPTVRWQLREWFGGAVERWRLLAVARVDAALPAALPPQGRLRKSVRVCEGLFVAGDSRDSPSIQGAMVSGRRAADAVREELR
jgi:predicted NAD/FAD-dependent oxidoreductase